MFFLSRLPLCRPGLGSASPSDGVLPRRAAPVVHQELSPRQRSTLSPPLILLSAWSLSSSPPFSTFTVFFCFFSCQHSLCLPTWMCFNHLSLASFWTFFCHFRLYLYSRKCFLDHTHALCLKKTLLFFFFFLFQFRACVHRRSFFMCSSAPLLEWPETIGIMHCKIATVWFYLLSVSFSSPISASLLSDGNAVFSSFLLRSVPSVTVCWAFSADSVSPKCVSVCVSVTKGCILPGDGDRSLFVCFLFAPVCRLLSQKGVCDTSEGETCSPRRDAFSSPPASHVHPKTKV